jgi:hypothetical protein
MTKKIISLFILTTLLIGCGPVTPIAPSPIELPIIKFERPNILDRMQIGYDFDLNVGIFAVDESLVFLFGSIGEFSDYPLQSTILRSEDGGQHWIEVMKPEQISRVIDFQMLESGNGWALTQVRDEAVGKITLFHTTDLGMSWEKLSEIPKDTLLGFPTLMYFGNDAEGQIDIVYPYEMPAGYISHLSSYDGGKSWKETGRYSPPFEDYITQSNITNAYQYHIEDYHESLSLDRRSLWKVESTNDEIIISRKLPKPQDDASGFIIWDNWETINTLPIQLNYRDGIILLP